jgi:hypothetical protein
MVGQLARCEHKLLANTTGLARCFNVAAIHDTATVNDQMALLEQNPQLTPVERTSQARICWEQREYCRFDCTEVSEVVLFDEEFADVGLTNSRLTSLNPQFPRSSQHNAESPPR